MERWVGEIVGWAIQQLAIAAFIVGVCALPIAFLVMLRNMWRNGEGGWVVGGVVNIALFAAGMWLLAQGHKVLGFAVALGLPFVLWAFVASREGAPGQKGAPAGKSEGAAD